MRSSLYALAGGASTALAAVRGFNYGSSAQTYETFSKQFQVASELVGADDFTSARIYTMIQDGTANTVISAIPAAISTNTTLLLGLWASENQAAFNNELTALKNAIAQYGEEFANLVVGISVGSEDLYRNSPTGIAAGSGYGQEPDVLVNYIGQVRSAIQNTVLSTKPVGHVDTWNDFINGSNSAVVAACDFLGLDEYPYYQTTDSNSIENAGSLFFEAYDKVAAVAGGKPIWVTESGWPVSGPVSGDASASTANAETYWQDVACELISRGIDFWWYILADAGATPSFGVTGSLSPEPLYNLACKKSSSSSSSSASSKSTVSASSVAQATTPLSASASTTVAISNPIPTAAASKIGSSSVNGTGSGSGEAVYVTDITTSYVTTCPVGQTLTANGSTTVLQTPSVMTTTTVVQATMTSSLSGHAGASGYAAASGTGAPGSGNTRASTWAGKQTPTGSAGASTPSVYTGSASKMAGSAAMALGAVAAVFAL